MLYGFLVLQTECKTLHQQKDYDSFSPATEPAISLRYTCVVWEEWYLLIQVAGKNKPDEMCDESWHIDKSEH